MGNIKKPCGLAGGLMFHEEATVFHGKIPSAEIDHARTELGVAGSEWTSRNRRIHWN
jgi:hypothetical protein